MGKKSKDTYMSSQSQQHICFFDTPIVFIDFEYVTTRFKHDGHREYLQEIVEIGVIYVYKETKITYSQIVKPEFYLTHINTNSLTTKFEFNQLVNGVSFVDVILQFRKYYIPGFTKVISWGGSDLHNFNFLCEKQNIDFSVRKTDYIDLSQRFRRFYNLTQSVKLEKALSIIHMDTHYDKHRALPDTEMLVKIFNHMIADGFDKENAIFKRRPNL